VAIWWTRAAVEAAPRRPFILNVSAQSSVLWQRVETGPRPSQGRGRGFESLRPLQDLIDLTTVGKCARGNIWGNSTHITNAFWRSAARRSSSPRNLRFQLVHQSRGKASSQFAIAKFAVGMNGAMAKKEWRSDLARPRIKYHCIDRSSQTRAPRHKLTTQPRSFSGALLVRISQRWKLDRP
jgi:hypothetical protein